MAKPRYVRNTLRLIDGKKLLGDELANEVALPVLISLDAAKRSKAPASLANILTQHLLIATVIWTSLKNRRVYDATAKAWEALRKAAERPTQLLDLTTGEYEAIREALSYYVRALPQVELKTFAYAGQVALHELNREEAVCEQLT